MGLAQKRPVEEFQTTAFVKWLESFHEIVGFEMPIEVEWDTLHNDAHGKKDEYFSWHEAVYFPPLMVVFKEIRADDTGKRDIKEGVKSWKKMIESGL